jgi:glycosyltransferase involved in cell wall biosynthesis
VKVLHVIQDMSLRSGGPPVTVTEACLALNRRGVRTTIVTTDAALMASAASRERLTPEDLPPGADQLDLRICRRQPLRRFAVSLPLQRLLQRIVPSYEVVHIHALYLFPHFAAYRAARRHRVPYVVSPHGALDPYHRGQKRGRKAIAWWLWQGAELEHATLIHMLAPEELSLIHDVAPGVPRAVVPVGIPWSGVSPALFRSSIQGSSSEWI